MGRKIRIYFEELAWIQPAYLVCDEGCFVSLYAFVSPEYEDNVVFHWEPGGIEGSIFSNACTGVIYTITAVDTLGQPIPSEEISSMVQGQAVLFGNEVGIYSDAVEADIITTKENDLCDGVAILTSTTSTGPFVYEWSNGTTGQSATDLCEGEYSVTITGYAGEGCSETYSLTIDHQAVVAKCDTLCDLQISAHVLQGEPPYQFLWQSSQQTTSTIGNVCPGETYSCVITDANGNEISSENIIITYQNIAFFGNEITLPNSVDIQPLMSLSPENGNCNGTVQLSTEGGEAPYDFIWESDEVTSNFITNLCQGTYFFSVTDQNNCTVTDSVYINSIELEAICDSICNQEITIVAIGGNNSSYQYLWSPSGQTGYTATNLCPGETYSCVVTDSLGNEIPEENLIIFYQNIAFSGNSIVLPSTDFINLSFETTFDNGDCNGTATVLPSNGTPPYTYDWLGQNSNSQTIDGLCEGEYSVLVSDLNCSATASVSVSTNVSISTLSSNDFAFNIIPNPANDLIVIHQSGVGQKRLSLYNASGKKVFETMFVNTKKIVDISILDAGLYFIVVDDGVQFVKKSFVKL